MWMPTCDSYCHLIRQRIRTPQSLEDRDRGHVSRDEANLASVHSPTSRREENVVVSEVTTDYLVIGAGPAGLQASYLLSRAGRDHLVLEAGDAAGTFFTRFPRHRK